MTRDIRIALLIGLAFITLFGIVLGQRSLKLSSAAMSEAAPSARPPDRPGPEVAVIAVQRDDDRPVLSPPRPAAATVARRAREAPARVAAADPPDQSTGELLEVGHASERPAAERIAPVMVAEAGPARPHPAVQVEIVRGPDPPAAALAKTYRVQPGDSLRKIARKVYGADHEDRYVLIYEANKEKLRDAHTVIVGDVLTIPPPASGRGGPSVPPAAATRRPYVEASAEELNETIRRMLPGPAVREFVVQKGDNLTRIAKQEMGSGSRANVRKLIEANKDRLDDPDRLMPGMKLRIPQ